MRNLAGAIMDSTGKSKQAEGLAPEASFTTACLMDESEASPQTRFDCPLARRKQQRLPFLGGNVLTIFAFLLVGVVLFVLVTV